MANPKNRNNPAPPKNIAAAESTAKPVWAERMAEPPNALAIAYTSGRDVRALPPADLALAPFDVWTNRAHVAMLADCGIIQNAAAKKIGAALKKLDALIANGEFALDARLEDVHMNVERFVAKEAGEAVAGLMHTARSRNDQILTVLRLFMREAIQRLAEGAAELALALIARAKADAKYPLPGLSHTQPGAVTSLGHWWASHAQALARDLDALRALEAFADASPLGAAHGFGSSWPIDRAKAARYMGFASVQLNSLDCVTSRGELEARYAAAASSMMNHLSVLAQDIVTLSSPPRRYISLSDAFVTGSSIMPQKRNPDFCEITRAKAALAHGALVALLGVGRGAISGYNRDQQWTKYMVMDLASEIEDAPRVFAAALPSITVDAEAMREAAASEYMNAVEVADFLAQTRGLPFRQAHALVAAACRESASEGTLTLEGVNREMKVKKGVAPLTRDEWAGLENPAKILARRVSAGSPNTGLLATEVEALRKAIAAESKRLAARRGGLAAALERVVKRLAR